MARRLLLLNGLAAFAVVIHHTAAYGLQAMFEWTNRYRAVAVPNYDQLGSAPYYALMTIRHLDGYALPAFLFVSGFFAAFMARSEQPWGAVTKRIQQLLAPFVIWTLIRYILLMRVPSTVDDILNPYHFIPVLCQFYLLSPLIVSAARKWWKSVLFMAAAFQLGLLGYRYMNILGETLPFQEYVLSMPRWIFLEYSFWFPLGVVVGLQPRQSQLLFRRMKWRLLAGLIGVAVLTMVEYEVVASVTGNEWLGPTFRGATGVVYSLLFILCFLAFDQISVPFSEQLSQIGSRSLGIYMANIPAIYVLAVFMYDVTPWALGNQLVYQLVLFAAGLGGPLLLMELLRRTPARQAYSYVFG